MTANEINWLYPGYAVWAIVWTGFAWAALQRRWTWTGLLIALANMVIVMIHAVAPFRGVLDPEYVGYSFLLLSVPPGIGVTLVTGPIVLISWACALIALRNRRGKPMLLLAGWNGVLAAFIGLPLLYTLFTAPSQFAIHLGEYVTIPWFVALPLMLVVVTLPFAAAVPWALSRVRADALTLRS